MLGVSKIAALGEAAEVVGGRYLPFYVSGIPEADDRTVGATLRFGNRLGWVNERVRDAELGVAVIQMYTTWVIWQVHLGYMKAWGPYPLSQWFGPKSENLVVLEGTSHYREEIFCREEVPGRIEIVEEYTSRRSSNQHLKLEFDLGGGKYTGSRHLAILENPLTHTPQGQTADSPPETNKGDFEVLAIPSGLAGAPLHIQGGTARGTANALQATLRMDRNLYRFNPNIGYDYCLMHVAEPESSAAVEQLFVSWYLWRASLGEFNSLLPESLLSEVRCREIVNSFRGPIGPNELVDGRIEITEEGPGVDGYYVIRLAFDIGEGRHKGSRLILVPLALVNAPARARSQTA